MAKLEGVKVLDMINGQITKVEYDGEVYEKTGEEVAEGDLFQLLDGHRVIGGEVGAFYTTEKYHDGDIVIPTVRTGNATLTHENGWGVAFRKVTPTIEEVNAKVDSLAERVKSLEEENPEVIEHDGKQLRKVDRKCETGDYVRFPGLNLEGTINGKLYPVINGDEYRDEDGSVLKVYGWESSCPNPEIFEVAVTQTFREGDRVKALADGESGDIETGEIGVIEYTEAGAKGDPYSVSVETDDGVQDYFRPQDLELVTASEIKIGDYVVPTSKNRYTITSAPEMKLGKVVDGHICVQDDIRVEIVAHVDTDHIGDSFSVNSKYFRKATDEEAKFAKIGREPGEFKKGDIVRLLKDSGADENGAFVEIARDGACAFIGADGNVYGSMAYWFELIAPVEARVDQQ